MKSPQTYLIALLSLTTIGGAILAWQQYGELVELRAAAMNKDERADLQKRVWDLEKSNKQLRDQLAGQRRDGEADALAIINGDGPSDRPGRGPDGRGGRGGNPMQQLSAVRDLMNKPEVMALLSVQQKAAVEARYAALFKSLNLSPEQAEKLKAVLAERQTTMMDVMSAARDQGIDPRRDPEAFQKLMAMAQNDINSSIKAVIGDSGFAQFETYEKTLPQRNVVNQLQQRLSYTDTPLSTAQAEQLVQILAANTPTPSANSAAAAPPPPPSDGGRGPGGGRPGGPDLGAIGAMIGNFAGGGGPGGGMLAIAADGGRGSTTAPVTTTAVNQAQAVLAAPQVAALQQIQQQQQSQQQLAKIIGDTLSAQNPGGGRPGGLPPTSGASTKKGGG